MTVATEDIGLSIDAAAEELGIHPRTLRRYINEGRIEVVRYTSQIVRIDRAELKRFLKDNLLVETGTGMSYAPRPKRKAPRKAAAPRFKQG